MRAASRWARRRYQGRRAVVGELHAQLVLAGGHRLGAADAEAGHTEEVVAVARPALMEIQRLAAERSALRDQHAVRAAVGDFELGGDRVSCS